MNDNGKKGTDNTILTVSHLNTYYREKTGRFSSSSVRRQVLKDVSFDIKQGEIVDAASLHLRRRSLG